MCKDNTQQQLEARLEALRVELAETRGRLANAPTAFQILSWFAGIAIGLAGLIFALARAVLG